MFKRWYVAFIVLALSIPLTYRYYITRTLNDDRYISNRILARAYYVISHNPTKSGFTVSESTLRRGSPDFFRTSNLYCVRFMPRHDFEFVISYCLNVRSKEETVTAY